MLFANCYDPLFFFRSNGSCPSPDRRLGLAFEKPEILAVKAVLPGIENFGSNRKMPACLRGIFVCFGLVIYEPFQPLAGFFGKIKELGLFSPIGMFVERRLQILQAFAVIIIEHLFDEIYAGNHPLILPTAGPQGYYRCISSYAALGHSVSKLR